MADAGGCASPPPCVTQVRGRVEMNKKSGASGPNIRHRASHGQGEIRTLDTLSGMPVFETGAFSHSATCPGVTKANEITRLLVLGGREMGRGTTTSRLPFTSFPRRTPAAEPRIRPRILPLQLRRGD